MCYLRSVALMTHIQETVGLLTNQCKSFTGWDVYKQLDSDLVGEASPRDISSYVRELLNTKALVFKGYASYAVQGGPLVFFPFEAVDQNVREYVQGIKQILQEKKEKTQTREAC